MTYDLSQDRYHAIEWDPVAETPRFVCHAPLEAYCHAIWPCECDNHAEIAVVGEHWEHRGAEGPHLSAYQELAACNYRDWIEAAGVEEAGPDGDLLVRYFHDGEVRLSWTGDDYRWEYAEDVVTS